MTRVLCTGDLHIGAGTDHRVDALADQELVLGQVSDLALDRGVDLVLIAGDVFHRPKPNPAELHVFARFAKALEALQVPAIAILGNAGHDQWGVDQPTALELFSSPWLTVSRTPELVKGPGDVAVCTLPSVPVHRLVAAEGGGDRAVVNQVAAELLVETARGLRSQAPEGWPSILLGHWSVTGAALPNGLPTDDLHEPVLSIAALEELGFTAIALGHIHRAQPLVETGFYVGSPGVQNFGEAGFEHGVWIVDLDADGAWEFVELEDRRFVTVDVDLTEVDGRDTITMLDETDLIASACPFGDEAAGAVVRVRYRATEAQHRRVDQTALRTLVMDAGAHKLYQIAPDIIRESRARAEHVDETLGPLEAVSAWSTANHVDDAPAEALEGLTVELLGAAA